MAPPTGELLLATSQRAIAAFHEQLHAARNGLEAVRAPRAGLLAAGSADDLARAAVAALESASAAGCAFRRAHAELMDSQYAERRGEEAHVELMDSQYAERRGEQAQQPPPRPEPGGTDSAESGPAAAPGAAAAPSPEERQERRRLEAHARKWAVPEDEGARRAAAATSAAAGPTAAAAAFAAAEEAARRRLAERPEAAGEECVWYPWMEGAEAYYHDREEGQTPNALTKVVGGQKSFDFSMFHKEAWERAQQQAEAMLAEQVAGVVCWRESLPRPQQRVPGVSQVKVRVVQTNTEEKISRAYQAMAAGGGADRNGYLLGASLGRFITLAKDKSDSPEAKNGGDLGWVVRGKLDPKLEEVAFGCPRGACTPPFRVRLANFCLVFCEDRR